jgi:hypothetical protein
MKNCQYSWHRLQMWMSCKGTHLKLLCSTQAFGQVKAAKMNVLQRVGGELRYFWHAIYFKVQYQMYSYFKRSSIHRQLAVSSNVPDWEKKMSAIDGPPHFVFQCSPPVPNQCKFCQCYATGATLKCGVTLADFLFHGGTLRNSHKTHPPTSSKFIHNDERYPKEWWIHPFLALRDHTNHPNFNVQHPRITRTWQGEKKSSHSVFSSWLVPGAIRPRPRLPGFLTCVSCGTSLTRMPPKHCGRVDLMRCSKNGV